MTRTAILIAVLVACLIAPVPGTGILNAASGQTVPGMPASIADLLQRSQEMDGKEVRLVGEAVGDLMVRGEYAWLNVLDATGMAIGVYLPKDEALKVSRMGRYPQKGDVVDITGTFHDACPLHDGEPDIHADSLVVVEQGGPLDHPVQTSRAVLEGALLLLAGLMGLAVRRRRLGAPTAGSHG